MTHCEPLRDVFKVEVMSEGTGRNYREAEEQHFPETDVDVQKLVNLGGFSTTEKIQTAWKMGVKIILL